MTRIGDLMPDAARGLGLEDELRLSRAIATFDAIVAERVPRPPAPAGSFRIDGDALVVEADAPIVAQELRLHVDGAARGVRGGAGRRRGPRDRGSIVRRGRSAAGLIREHHRGVKASRSASRPDLQPSRGVRPEVHPTRLADPRRPPLPGTAATRGPTWPSVSR